MPKSDADKPRTRVVLHWVEEDKVSIEDLAKINDEDRYVGAPTTVKYGNKHHKAVVKLISSDHSKLDEILTEICDEIETRKQGEQAKEAENIKTRNSRHKVSSGSGVASASQVSSALGERVAAPISLQKKATDLKKRAKDANKAHHEASVDVDAAITVTSTRKNLFPADGKSDESDTNIASDIDEDSDNCSDGSEMSCKGSAATVRMTCDGCRPLTQAVSKSVPEFLIQLEAFVAASSASTGERYLEVLSIPPGVPKVELTKGSKVYMTVHDKNEIKSECAGNPSKMVRDCLVRLFGRDAMETLNITAKGSRIGSIGIRSEVREAIRKFANRNKTPQYKDLDTKSVTKVINRKKNQVYRTNKGKSKSPRSLQKNMSHKKSMSELSRLTPSTSSNSPFKITPRSSIQSNSVRKSPYKYTTPRKSPPNKNSWQVTPQHPNQVLNGNQYGGSYYPPHHGPSSSSNVNPAYGYHVPNSSNVDPAYGYHGPSSSNVDPAYGYHGPSSSNVDPPSYGCTGPSHGPNENNSMYGSSAWPADSEENVPNFVLAKL